MKYWEVIADNLSKAGWSWGCVSAIDPNGRQFWVVSAEREDAGRFIVHAHELLTAFPELQSAIRDKGVSVAPTLLVASTASAVRAPGDPPPLRAVFRFVTSALLNGANG